MSSLVLLLCLVPSLTTVHSQGIGCMTIHCFSSMTKCFTNADCKAAVSCLGACGTNQSCALPCLATYENKLLDDFLYCAVTQHQCIKLPAPNPPFECKAPSAPSLPSFSLSWFGGTWYVLLGRNRNYDCFDCQVSTYSPVPDSRNYTLSEDYLAPTLNHSSRVMVSNMSAEIKDPKQGGLVTCSGLENGLPRAEQWRILVYDSVANYSVIYYCGETGSWKYEGTLVYSREPVLSASNMAKLKEDMARVGFDIADFCVPRTSNCTVPYRRYTV